MRKYCVFWFWYTTYLLVSLTVIGQPGCWQILQWSYPYAFFEFEGEDYGDYSRYVRRTARCLPAASANHASSTSNNHRPQPRRSRFERTSGHRPSFDMLQGELETLVETLSGTVGLLY